MLLSLVLSLAVPAPPPARAADTDDVLARVEEVVDLETPRERRRAADALAKELDLDALELAALLARFGRFAPDSPGVRTETVPLFVEDAVEPTEIAVFVPSAYDPETPAPLLLAFHGTGGTGAFALGMWREVAEAVGMLVVAPTDTGPNQGYTFSPHERAAALAALRWARRRWNVDEDRVFVTGVSRGGHLAWDLALRFPDRFAGLAPLIGGPRIALANGQNNLRYLENVAHLSIRDLQGAEDDPGLVFNVRLAFERLAALGAPDAILDLQEGRGHSFDPTAVDWAAWFAAARRDPHPERVVRLAAREGEGRAFWVEVLATGRDVEEVFTPRVLASEWNTLDDEGKRRRLVHEADERTARLAARRVGPGRVELEARGVTRCRLLFTAADLGEDGRVTVRSGKRSVRRRLRLSRRVLLEEFVERFDRRFLPVADLELRP